MSDKTKTLPMQISRDWLVSMLEHDTLPTGMTYHDLVQGASNKQEAIDFLKTQPDLLPQRTEDPQ